MSRCFSDLQHVITLPDAGLDSRVWGRRVQELDDKTPDHCSFDRPSSGVLLLALQAWQLKIERMFMFDPISSQRYVMLCALLMRVSMTVIRRNGQH